MCLCVTIVIKEKGAINLIVRVTGRLEGGYLGGDRERKGFNSILTHLLLMFSVSFACLFSSFSFQDTNSLSDV